MPRSNFQRIYPKEGRIVLDGGKNDSSDRSLILDGQSPDCLNVIFDDSKVQTRGGTSKLNTSAVGSYVCDGLYTRHDNSGYESMVAWFGGTLYALSGTTFNTISSAQSIYTAGQKVYASEYENYMFFGNGSNTPYKYANGEFTRHGIYAPTAAPTAATAATGSALSGTYSYKVTYLNSGLVESDASVVSNTFTAASENIALTSIPTAPLSWGVGSRRIYRTKDGGSTYFRIATISDNSTTTYEDAIEDSALVTEEPDDQGVPPNYSAIVYHLGRLFVIDPSTNLVKYSEAGNPYVFKALSFRRIGDTSGDIPRMLAVYNGSVVVGCDRSIWIIYTPDSTDTNWTDIRVVTPYGCVAGFSPFTYNNKLMFAATLYGDFVGFAALDGGSLDPSVSILIRSNLGSDMKSAVIEREMFQVPDDYQNNIASISWKNRAYIAGPYGSTQTTNNRIWYFDYSYENLDRPMKFAWSPWTGLNANFFTVYQNNLYYGTSDASGFVYLMNQGASNDDGVAIDSYIWSKEYFGFSSDENWVKDWRFINLFLDRAKSGDLLLQGRIDSSSENPTDIKEISLVGAFIWDLGAWDEMGWDISDSARELKIPIGTFRGKRIQFKFSNDSVVDTKFSIVGIRLTYNLRGFR